MGACARDGERCPPRAKLFTLLMQFCGAASAFPVCSRLVGNKPGTLAPLPHSLPIWQPTPGLKVILFRRYITSIKMTFDPGVGVPPTGAAASLAPRFLTVLGFYRLFPVRSLPSRMNRERCGNSARPVSRCADSHWRVHAWWAERVQAASTATIIRVRRESGLPPPTSGSCSPPPPPPPPPAG